MMTKTKYLDIWDCIRKCEGFADNRDLWLCENDISDSEVIEFEAFVSGAIEELPDDPKSCPFCGSNDGVNYIRSYGAIESVATECKNCKAKGPKATKLDDESWEQVDEMKALELWNTRTDEHHE